MLRDNEWSRIVTERDRREIPEDLIPGGLPEKCVETEIKESAQEAPPLETMERAWTGTRDSDSDGDLPPLDELDETTKTSNE